MSNLARWGSHGPMAAGNELSADALLFALKTSFDEGAAGKLDATYEIRLGADRFHAEIGNGRLDLARGAAEHPDAVVDTDAGTLRSLVFGGHDLAGAIGDGTLKVEGDERALVAPLRAAPHGNSR